MLFLRTPLVACHRRRSHNHYYFTKRHRRRNWHSLARRASWNTVSRLGASQPYEFLRGSIQKRGRRIIFQRLSIPVLSNPVIQFSFWVTEVNEDGEEQDFWNGEDTEFIPREERAQICLKLKTAAEMLIFAERPRCVGLCAADAQERAYHRFLLVAEVFRENWYRVTELEPHLGSRAWLMERAGL